jgi:xanthine dehydrogenase YagT iron-sulfur-binding subunit
MTEFESNGVTRRDFLIASTATVAVTALPLSGKAQTLPSNVTSTAGRREEVLPLTLTINGRQHALNVDTRTTLLDVLREHLHFTGTKKGCDHGQCGACTVLVNGVRINACLTLGVMHQHDAVTTIEGLGSADHLHPMQQAFIKHDGFQCGYCTPGQICSAVAVLGEIKKGIPSHVSIDLLKMPRPTTDEIRERMSGNLCRCGGYSNIIDAISEVSEAQGSAA